MNAELGVSGMLDDQVDQLRAFGLTVRVNTDQRPAPGVGRGELVLGRGDRERRYTLRYGHDVPLSAVARGEDGRGTFVIAHAVSPRTADAFRRAGVQYVDAAGNAWIRFADVVIDVRGRPRPKVEIAPRRTAANLFTPSRAQVVMALIAWPQLWGATQREIASASGVSVGQVNATLPLIEQSGYHRGRPTLGQPPLVDVWAAAFSSGLARRITLARYHGDGALVGETVGPTRLSGGALVANLVRSDSVVLYVPELDTRLAFRHRWRTDGHLNITVRRWFWSDPEPVSTAAAPWPLVYADLLADEDPRVRAAAQQWREGHAGPDART